MTAFEDRLRDDIRRAIDESGRVQVLIADELGITPKHLSQMLTGRAQLTLDWAARIAAACGYQVVVNVIYPAEELTR